MAKTAYVRALALLLATAACWPLTARADTYPAQSGKIIYNTTTFGLTDVAVCQRWAVDGANGHPYTGNWQTGWGVVAVADQVCGGSAGPTWCADYAFGCRVIAPGMGCLYGGTLSGSNCLTASACPAEQVRDPGTGECGPTKKQKNYGQPVDPLICVANPCNAGTGTKFQVETVFRSGAAALLVEQLSYNSRLLSDAGSIWNGAYGKGWKGHYERRVVVVSTGVALLERPDGRQIDFRPPSSGNVYVGDADVADRLERLVDGGGSTTGWKYVVAADDSTELYGPTGNLLSISDRAGSTQTLAYSDASMPPAIAPVPGLLIGVSDPWGRAISYIYDNQKRIVRMTDPAGGNYDYAYDAAGNLASITFPDAKVRAYKYNEPENTQSTALPNSLTGIIDENGARFATFKYDTQGRVVSSEHAGGAQKSALDYTSPGVSTTVTDALGVARSYGLTTLLWAVKGTGISGAACPTCGPPAQTHDANGNVASRTDWNGNQAIYAFDSTRNLEISRTEANGTPQQRTTSTEWHSTFRLPTQIVEPLRTTTNAYDADGAQCGARGALCSRTVQATSGATRTWTYTYNANGQVVTVNGPRSDVSDLTTYTYDAQGNVASITNAAGHVTSITAYNAHGQPLTIVDPNGMTTTLGYDARQRLTSRSSGGEVTSYDYDGVGQLTKLTLPDGSFLSYSYDAAHRLTGMADNLGNSIAYTLDAMGNRTLEQVFDPASALAQKRSRVYNSLNRLFQELGAQNQPTEYAYDDQSNVVSVKDPLSRVTANQYDALNRLKQVTDPALGVTQYGYNGLDALTQVTDPRSLVTGYTVDGLGNLTQQSSPDTGSTVSTYDAAGNLLTQTDAKGQVTTYTYDALNRVTLITFNDGSKQSYFYDQGANGIGRLMSISETNPANQVTNQIAYAYDLHGRVASETRTVNGVQYLLSYTYDTAGRLSGLTYPSGRTVTYTSDGLGRVIQVTTTKDSQSQVVVSSVLYQPFGGVKGYTLGNSQVYSRGIDLDGRIASYTLGAQSFGIGYDAASRITFISDFANPANANTYDYDSLDRLTQAVTPGTPYAYSYDAVGNRMSRAAGSSTDTYAYSSSSNRIASVTPSAGPVRSFVFDANGSTTADGNNTYAYDTRGRMVQATSSLGATTYQVNALGQRIRKTNSLGDTVFHYDTRGRLIAETDAAGGVKRELIYLGDIPVGVVQ